MGCQGIVVMKKEGAAYQEQHEVSWHDALSPRSGRCHAPNRRFRPDCVSSDIVLDGNSLLRVVTSFDKRSSSWRINNGGLIKEVISEEVKALDSAISEGGVREVGFKA
jgi:hypothetical protein